MLSLKFIFIFTSLTPCVLACLLCLRGIDDDWHYDAMNEIALLFISSFIQKKSSRCCCIDFLPLITLLMLRRAAGDCYCCCFSFEITSTTTTTTIKIQSDWAQLFNYLYFFSITNIDRKYFILSFSLSLSLFVCLYCGMEWNRKFTIIMKKNKKKRKRRILLFIFIFFNQ